MAKAEKVGGKSKQIQAAKATSGGGGKGKAKKKWSKTKTREKLANLVVFDKATYDKLLKEIPPSKVITPSIISERLKVNGSLARKALKDLISKNLVKEVISNNHQQIYTRVGGSA